MGKGKHGVPGHITQEMKWQGPIPPPAALAAFSEIVPDAPERILRMAEEEARMRREVTVKNAESENRQREIEIKEYHADILRGQVFAFVVLCLAIAGATICAFLHCEKVGMTIAGMGMAGIVSNFIWKKK